MGAKAGCINHVHTAYWTLSDSIGRYRSYRRCCPIESDRTERVTMCECYRTIGLLSDYRTIGLSDYRSAIGVLSDFAIGLSDRGSTARGRARAHQLFSLKIPNSLPHKDF